MKKAKKITAQQDAITPDRGLFVRGDDLNASETWHVAKARDALRFIKDLPLDMRVSAINAIRQTLHEMSPFAGEPVDCVRWVRMDAVHANDYNPNSVAPPEMELLRVSILADGYTQPIVANHDGEKYVVVDGFHRNRVGKECKDVSVRLHGYLPVVQIRATQGDTPERMASTIRHNRARGKHRVEAMSDIVIELKQRNWSNERISRELGMDEDEILRLCQITGLAGLFSDQEFSKAWDVEGEITESDFKELSDDPQSFGEETASFRTVNTSDENRIFHTYDKWECHKAGFYASSKPGMTKAQCEEAYRAFLADIPRFSSALARVIAEWTNSCEHYLTNSALNRVAWLGQASMCLETGVPSEFRAGYFLLTPEQQDAANNAALEYLNRWLVAHDRAPVELHEAMSGDRQSVLY